MADYKTRLESLSVPSPCTEDWNNMTGDEKKRYCGQCKLHVHNISEMTERQAEKLLESSVGGVCVRFYRRQDGTVITRDCSRIRQSLSRVRHKVAAITAAIFAFFNLSSAFAQSTNSESNPAKNTKSGGSGTNNPSPTMGEPLRANATKATADKASTGASDAGGQTKTSDTPHVPMILGRVAPMKFPATVKPSTSGNSSKN